MNAGPTAKPGDMPMPRSRTRTVWSAHKRARGSSQHRPRSMLTAADAPLCSLSLASADSLPKLEVSTSSSEPLHLSPCLPAYLQQGQHHHTITGPERSHLGHQRLYVYIRDTPFPSSIPSQDRPRFQPPCGTTLPNPRRSKHNLHSELHTNDVSI